MIMSDFMPNDESVAPTTAPTGIWLKKLPYAVVLILSFTRRPLMRRYWGPSQQRIEDRRLRRKVAKDRVDEMRVIPSTDAFR